MSGYPYPPDPYGFNPGYPQPSAPPGGDYYPPPSYGSIVGQGMGSQYFLIRSRLNGLVLDIQGGNPTPGTRVVTWNQKPAPNDNQHWYEDAATGTIRSKLSPNLCLQPAGGGVGLIVQNYNPAEKKQQVALIGTSLHMRHNPKNVADIQGGNMGAGGKVVVSQATGSPQQQWEKVFAGVAPAPAVAYAAPPAFPAAQPQPAVQGYFLIRSKLNNMVCDIMQENAFHGQRVVTWPQKHPPADNQLWYEDAATGTYRNKMNPQLCLAAAGDGTGMKVHNFNPSDQKMKLQLSGNKLHNRVQTNKCVTIGGSNAAAGAKICMGDFNGGVNQMWELVPCPHSGMPPAVGAAYPAVAPAVAAPVPPMQVWSLQLSTGSPPLNALPLGHQNDGSGQLWLGVAHTNHGNIPGKAQGNTCWYPYGGKEQLTNNFSWVCAPPGSTRLEQNRGKRVPPNSLKVGLQNDGQGAMYAIVANTPQGQIPGKGNAKGQAHYCYGGKEIGAPTFYWVIS